MKKILLTTTAMVAFAGAASAEVSISGYAEMGIAGGDSFNYITDAVVSSETQFFQDIDVTFSMSGETDNGLTFGASVDIDETAAGTNTSDDNGTTIFISGGFGTITMGDTDGALDWALTEAGNVGNPGSMADNETEHSGYNGSYLDGAYEGQIVRYDNTFGDFGVALSVEMDDLGVQNTGYAIGLKYNLDLGGTTVALGLGHQNVQVANVAYTVKGVPIAVGTKIKATGLSASATFANGLSAGLVYTKVDAGVLADVKHIGVGVGYTTGALSLHANYGKYDDSVSGNTQKGYGIAVGYDLGGGASVLAGYGKSDNGFATTPVSTANWSLGLALSF